MRLAASLLFALLIERTVEVFLTIWLAEESYKRHAAVQRLISNGKSAINPDLKRAQDESIEFTTKTEHWALLGGADPIRKLMDAFRKFMEASSAKASGTSN